MHTQFWQQPIANESANDPNNDITDQTKATAFKYDSAEPASYSAKNKDDDD